MHLLHHVLSFNDNGDFGVTRNPDEIGQPYIFMTYAGSADTVSYDRQNSVLLVYNTCKDVVPGGTCIARCPDRHENQYGTVSIQYLSGGACSTSDIVEADTFVGPKTYSCTVPAYSGEVVEQAVCVLR